MLDLATKKDSLIYTFGIDEYASAISWSADGKKLVYSMHSRTVDSEDADGDHVFFVVEKGLLKEACLQEGGTLKGMVTYIAYSD